MLSLSTFAIAQQGPGCYTSSYGSIYAQGSVLEVDANNNYVYHHDNCVNNGGGTRVVRLIEWYCDGATAKQFRYTCPNGCMDGACRQSSSIWSGITGYATSWITGAVVATGYYPSHYGYAYGYGYPNEVLSTGDPGTYPGGPTSTQGQSLPNQGVSQTYLDSRFASMKATQAMYEKSGVLEDSANSYYGVDSVSGPGCRDTDKGNFYTKGTTYWNGWSVSDNCDGTVWLREWYCDGDTGKLIQYKCPNGCTDGACK